MVWGLWPSPLLSPGAPALPSLKLCSPRSVSPLSIALLRASLLLFIFRRRGTCSPERGSYSSSCGVGRKAQREGVGRGASNTHVRVSGEGWEPTP